MGERLFHSEFDPAHPAVVHYRELLDEICFETYFCRSKKALAGLSHLTLLCGNGPDFFESVRSEDHLHMFSPETALFYQPNPKQREIYGSFSAWHNPETPIEYMGRYLPTVEHGYQACKFALSDPEVAEMIWCSETPRKAKKLSEDHKKLVRRDWHATMHGRTTLKEMAMFGVVLAEVIQNPDIRTLLESTNRSVIVEDSIPDSSWGRGRDFRGENKLGLTWMTVREALRIHPRQNMANISNMIGNFFLTNI